MQGVFPSYYGTDIILSVRSNKTKFFLLQKLYINQISPSPFLFRGNNKYYSPAPENNGPCDIFTGGMDRGSSPIKYIEDSSVTVAEHARISNQIYLLKLLALTTQNSYLYGNVTHITYSCIHCW